MLINHALRCSSRSLIFLAARQRFLTTLPSQNTPNALYPVKVSGTFGTPSYKIELETTGKSELRSFWHHVPLFPHLSPKALYPSTDAIDVQQYRLATPEAESLFSSTDPTTHRPIFHDTSCVSLLDNDDLTKRIATWLQADNQKHIVNMIVEIPMNTLEKFEVATSVPGNPIIQDTYPSDGSLRCFKTSPILWNYGALPQTWEAPFVKTHHLKGDNDPLDLIEIGSSPFHRGDVVPVQVLGCLAMIDGEEMDWKIIALRENEFFNSDHQLTKTIDIIRHWLCTYKLPEGKQLNKFLYDGRLLSSIQAVSVIAEAHYRWRRLVQRATPSKHDALNVCSCDGYNTLWVPAHM